MVVHSRYLRRLVSTVITVILRAHHVIITLTFIPNKPATKLSGIAIVAKKVSRLTTLLVPFDNCDSSMLICAR